MAGVSRVRGIFGRLLAALGLAWVFWGLLGPAIGLEFGNSVVDLPIFPGIVILFIGRALSRGSRRGGPDRQPDAPAETRVPPRPEPQVRSVPIPERNIRQPVPTPEPVAVSDVMIEGFEAPMSDLSLPTDMPMRKTSAEMVAEARERYGRRP